MSEIMLGRRVDEGDELLAENAHDAIAGVLGPARVLTTR